MPIRRLVRAGALSAGREPECVSEGSTWTVIPPTHDETPPEGGAAYFVVRLRNSPLRLRWRRSRRVCSSAVGQETARRSASSHRVELLRFTKWVMYCHGRRNIPRYGDLRRRFILEVLTTKPRPKAGQRRLRPVSRPLHLNQCRARKPEHKRYPRVRRVQRSLSISRSHSVSGSRHRTGFPTSVCRVARCGFLFAITLPWGTAPNDETPTEGTGITAPRAGDL